MVDITHKSNTLREATAMAVVRVSKAQTIQAIKDKTVPKGDVFEMSRAAGLLAVKKTPELLPDCHPLPIEFARIDYTISGLEIHIECCLKTIYKTGVEVEAMHGATVVALNVYDMLKPLDKGIEIERIKLIEKKGGKSDSHPLKSQVKAAVVVCSDSIAAGKKEDRAGKAIIAALTSCDVPVAHYEIIPDEVEQIRSKVAAYKKEDIKIILFTGGTGLSPRDQTPEALAPLIDKKIPGMEEALRSYGQQRTPYAMLSRSVVGLSENTLILALPGSTKGAAQSMAALFPAVLHVFDIIKGGTH
ncbi:MAG: bifunctional molybdenum cofactor biosynthesis protein MoaC/MoaB [Flavobacteriaceae bacterium]